MTPQENDQRRRPGSLEPGRRFASLTEGVVPAPTVSLRTCQGTHKFYGSFVAKNL